MKHSEVKLELINDIDMYNMVEKGIRGGVSMISGRYAEANEPRMDTYDSSKPIKSLLYLDANSLYPTAMSMPLPIDQFEFAEDPESVDFASVDDDAEFGYILEVDGKTPEDKHDLFNDYPLIPEKMRVDVNKLSALQRQNLAAGKGTEKQSMSYTIEI